MRLSITLFFSLLATVQAMAQIEVDNNGENGSPKYLIEEVLLGNGVQLINYSYSGDSTLQYGYFEAGTSTIGIESGIVFTTGDVNNIDQPNTSGTTSVEVDETSSDQDLEDIIGTNTFDAAALEFDFVPAGDSIIFRYVFASEEYNEYVCSQFNDVFAFFIYPVSDPSAKQNVALIPGTAVPVSINTINNGTPGDVVEPGDLVCNVGDPGLDNTQYYVDNDDGSIEIEYDGFTVPMTAIAEVECGELYHIKMVIADVTDGRWDSGIFLEAESFYSPAITVEVESLAEDGTIIEDCRGAHFNFTRKDATSTQTVHFDISGDAVRGDSITQPGIDFVLPQDSVVFQPGESNVTLSIFPIADGITEGEESVFVTVYNISECGDTIPVTAELTILDEVAIESTPIGNSACSEDPATVAVNVVGGTPGYTFLWESGETTQQISVSDTSNNFFDVTITDAVGCFTVDSVELEVFPLPDISTNAGSDTSICIGDALQLTASGAINYTWSPDSTLNNPDISNPIATPLVDALYFVEGEDANGCTKIDSVQVTVHPLPVLIKPGEPVQICANDSTTVTLGGGVSYSWSPGAGLSSTSGGEITIGPTTDRSYDITVTDGNQCVSQDTLAVIVVNPPTVTTAGETTICPEFSTNISASGAVNYSWSPAEFLDDASGSVAVATVTDTTTFSVVGTDVNGCADTATVTINTLDYPVSNAGNDTSICQGQSVMLSGDGGIVYAWEPAETLDDTTLAAPTATPLDTTSYIMHIIAANTCIGRDTVVVNVIFPNITLGDSASLCRGDSILLEVKHVTSLTWTPTDGLADPNAVATMAHPDTDTEYFITAIDTFGCASADSIFVSVVEQPVVDAGNDENLCLGDTVALTASGGVSYTWANDSILNRTDSITVLAFPLTSQRAYVTVTDANGCSALDSLEIQVIELPSIELVDDTTVCGGLTTTLFLSPGTGHTYAWSPAQWMNDTTLAHPSITPLSDTTYIVTVTDVFNCQSEDSIQVTTQYATVHATASDTMICPEDELTTIADSAMSYTWAGPGTPDDATSDTVVWSGLATGTFIVTGTDNAGCQDQDTLELLVLSTPSVDAGSDIAVCPDASFTLTSDLASSYTWAPSAPLLAPNSQSTSGQISSDQMFYLTITDTNGCINTDSVFVDVFTLGTLQFLASPSQVCEGEQLSVSTNFSVTFWSDSTHLISGNGTTHIFQPAVGHVTTATALDNNDCQVDSTYSFAVNPVPILDLGSDTAICLDNSMNLIPGVTGNGIAAALWSPGSAVNDSTSLNTGFTMTQEVELILQVVDVNGCEDADTMTITPLAVDVSTTDTTICRNSDFEIAVSTNFRGGSSFTWSPDDAVVGLTDTTAVVVADSSKSITLVVADDDGCLDSAMLDLVILDLPDLSVNESLSPRCDEVDITLSAGPGVINIQWVYEGDTTLVDEYAYTIPYQGQDSVTLYAQGDNDCYNQVTHRTVIATFDEFFDIEMATVISPNMDGINDWLEVNVKDDLYECIDMYIYNRWGELMFHSSGYNHTWDATTFAGKPAPGGTYYYILEVAGQQLQGYVTVLRSE